MRPTPDQLEALFGFTFTAPERHLLTAVRDTLDPYERQHRYLLMMALQGCECPVCGYLLCQRSAGGPVITVPATVRPDDDYRCPSCQTGLTWHLGLIGGSQWFTVTDPQALQNRLALADAERRTATVTVTGPLDSPNARIAFGEPGPLPGHGDAPGHTVNGPADCPRCTLLRDNADWLALPEDAPPGRPAGLTEGTTQS
jgi:hypothetical protein